MLIVGSSSIQGLVFSPSITSREQIDCESFGDWISMAGGGGGGEETMALSPKNRVKFLCSHGGKILPRPTDGQLKYVGGETRVVAIPRDTNFSELMKKLTSLFDGDMLLKYQVIPEDLDALVSVRSDEDLKYMFNEYDRQESEGTPRLRTFLFPSTPTVVENQMNHHAVDQRYVDAINGIIRKTSNSIKISNNRPTISIPSACSSPKNNFISSACSSPKNNLISSACSSPRNHLSPEDFTLDSINHQLHMHRVQSSPSVCSLNDYAYHHHHHHRTSPSNSLSNQHIHHHYHQNYQYYPQRSSGNERLVSTFSLGRGSGHHHHLHGAAESSPSPFYPPTTRQHTAPCGRCNRYGQHHCLDDHGIKRLDRAGSLPPPNN